MFSTNCRLKIACRKGTFQAFRSCSWQSFTRKSAKGEPSLTGGVIIILSSNQLLFHSGIELPSPIRYLLPALKMNLELQILRQTKLGLWPKVESRKLHLRKYLALYILEMSVTGLVIILHPCFPNIAVLKIPRLLKPIPLSFCAWTVYPKIAN
jgi:hypothetical protein